jgi:transcription elongation factor GreA
VAKDIVLTAEGYEELKKRYEHLTTEGRREVAERIKEARDFGDISENSEYDDAKNEQAKIEDEIAELEQQLREATIVEKADLKVGVVAIGSTVSVKGARNKEMKFKLVGSAEADPDLNRLSNESPIGRAVLGGKKGDKVDVVTPKGTVKYEITAISRV